jgi:RNA polymerase sigma-70 factor (family 1)
MPQTPPIDIIACIKDNDNRAIDYLYKEFYHQLNYFAVSLISDHEEAEDIVIDTFRKFWVLRQNFESLTNIKAFLFITTRNACFNYIEYCRNQKKRKKEYFHFTMEDFEEDAENSMIQAEVMNKLIEEIEKLPPKCRTIMHLLMQGLKPKEIAEKLNINPLTVHSQKRRAVELLKTALTKKRLLFFLLIFIR